MGGNVLIYLRIIELLDCISYNVPSNNPSTSTVINKFTFLMVSYCKRFPFIGLSFRSSFALAYDNDFSVSFENLNDIFNSDHHSENLSRSGFLPSLA